MRIVKSAVELQAIVAEVMSSAMISIVRKEDGSVDYALSTVCDIACDRPFEDLSPEELTSLNEFAMDNMQFVLLELNPEVVQSLMGIHEVDPTQTAPWAKIGDKYYGATHNATNRPTGLPIAKKYSESMLAGLWAILTNGSIDCLGNVATMAHRCLAAMLSHAAGNTDYPVLGVTFGQPPQYANIQDIGKTNTKSDVFLRDVDIIPDSVWDDIAELIPPADRRAKYRSDAAKQMITLLSNLNQRMNGKDLHAGGGSKFDSTAMRSLRSRFDRHAIDRLILDCVYRSKDEKGKTVNWASYIAPNVVALAIILLSNRVPNEDGTLLVDIDIQESILSGLATSAIDPKSGTAIGGDYAPLLTALWSANKAAKPSSLTAEAKFDLVVGFLGHYPILNTEVKPSWKGKRDKSLTKYKFFGGIDIGFQEKASKE